MKSTRKAYGETLVELGKKDEDIIVLDADLSKATCTNLFKKSFPNRHINIGIAEQDMVSTAAGLAMAGKKVFASSFAMFLAGRAYEQVRNSVAYNNANVKLCATHAGLSVGEDGATHQCIEDIALMTAIPNMIVIQPSDDVQTKKLITKIADIETPVYCRLTRPEVNTIYTEENTFDIGKSFVFGDGVDGTIFASGVTVNIALEAKEELKEKGIDVRVVDLYSIKPVDKDTIIKCAKETKKLISIEDHSVYGGIGSIISNVLTDCYPKKLIKIGVQDVFGKSGNSKEVLDRYGINKENIINKF